MTFAAVKILASNAQWLLHVHILEDQINAPRSNGYSGEKTMGSNFSGFTTEKNHSLFTQHGKLTLLHSESPKLHTTLAFLSAIGLKKIES